MGTNLKIGILFFLGLTMAIWFTLFVSDFSSGDGSYKINFSRVLRLRKGDAVNYNGIKVGAVRSITPVIKDGRAQVQVAFDFLNPQDVANILVNEKTRFTISRTFIGATDLEIESDGTGISITPDFCEKHPGVDPVDFNTLIAKASGMLDDNREALNSAMKELPIAIKELGAMSKGIKDTIAENRENIKTTITTVNKTVEEVGTAVNAIKPDLINTAKQLPPAIAVVQNLAQDLRDAVAANRAYLDTIMKGAAEFMPKLNAIGDDVKNITGEVTKGDGTAHELIYERRLADKAETLVDSITQRSEEVKPLTSGFSQLRVYLDGWAVYDTQSGASAEGANVRIEPKPWKIIEAGISYRTAPTDRNAATEDPNKFHMDLTGLLGWRFFADDKEEIYRLTVKGGLIENNFGAIVELPIYGDALSLIWMNRLKDNTRNPNDRRYEEGDVMGRASLNWNFHRNFHLSVGANDLYQRPGFMVGAGITLQDNDLRNIISMMGF
jgi:ABC-type transporter Mla subunit MlaD